MLSDLRACKDRASLALLLGIAPKELSYTLYKIADADKYQSFCISKKNGSARHILAPCSRLKWIQRKLLEALYLCDDEIIANTKLEPNLSFGFRREFGIIQNANRHKKRSFVLNLDIKDFFDQFNFGRVRGFFIKDRDFELDPFIATVIAQIACFENKLPQGAPTSPHIANLVTKFFDVRMARFLRSRKCTYSRYADDITISTNLLDFPSDVALESGDPQGWEISVELQEIFERAGFEINPQKTRMSMWNSRQTVTGLTVNSRPNVCRDFYLTTRAMCHSLVKTGNVVAKPFCDPFGNNCDPEKADTSIKESFNILEGRLSHIHYVREYYDTRTFKEKREKPTQHWRTFRKFLQYKYFVINKTPTVLTEGASDVVYLRLAISRSNLDLKHLNIEIDDKKYLGIHLMRHSGNPAEILGLTGGAGNLERFLNQYAREMRGFYTANRTRPTIIITDNDAAGGKVCAKANSLFGSKIDIGDPIEGHEITDKLHLIKTSHMGPLKETSIEDYLPDSVKEVELNGKKFSSKDGADS